MTRNGNAEGRWTPRDRMEAMPTPNCLALGHVSHKKKDLLVRSWWLISALLGQDAGSSLSITNLDANCLAFGYMYLASSSASGIFPAFATNFFLIKRLCQH